MAAGHLGPITDLYQKLEIMKKKKRQKLTIFDARDVENDIIKHFASFFQHFVLLSPKKRETHILIPKGLTTCNL